MSGSANGGWAASRFLAPYYVSSALLTAPVYLALRWWFLARSDLSHARIFSGDELWEKVWGAWGALTACVPGIGTCLPRAAAPRCGCRRAAAAA